MEVRLIILLSILIIQIRCYGQQLEYELKHKNFEQLYELGKDAYLENDFESCIKYFEAALLDYR